MSAKRAGPRVVADGDAEPAASAPVALSLRHLAIGLIAEAEEQVQRRAAGPVGTAARALRPIRRQVGRVPLVDRGARQVLAASPVPVLVLPSTAVLQRATFSASPQVVDESGHPVELLLVEDEPGDVQLTREALDEVGLRNALHVVDDKKCALLFLRQEPPYEDAPRPGLVLLDLEMRGTEGRELLATIKEDPQLRSIPVVALTTSTAEADVELAYRLGANCLVTTPVRFSEFVKAIRAIGRFWFATATLPSEPEQSGTVAAQSTDGE